MEQNTVRHKIKVKLIDVYEYKKKIIYRTYHDARAQFSTLYYFD